MSRTSSFGDAKPSYLPLHTPMSEPAAAGPPPNPLATWFGEWSGRTPPASRFVMITVVVLWLIGMLTGQALGAFANTPYYVIFHYEGAGVLRREYHSRKHTNFPPPHCACTFASLWLAGNTAATPSPSSSHTALHAVAPRVGH